MSKNLDSQIFLRSDYRVAVVHDWIFTRRGGERVLERILNLFPQADLYYLFGNPDNVLKLKNKHKLFPSFLNHVPYISKIYKWLLPLLPIAAESFDLSSYELVISSSSCVAKGIIPPPLGKHISYIHSPMRYAWDQEHRYFKKTPSIFRPLEILRRILLSRLRLWDVTSSQRIDKIIANSQFVARRCQLFYGKQSVVVYPPVDLKDFETIQPKENSEIKKVLLFGAWVPYKKMYDALKLLVKSNIPVIAAGRGEELDKAINEFKSGVEFYPNPKDEDLKKIYNAAHVLLAPGIEDFGIIPLEASANGLWVVAPNQGGTKETVINDQTGFTFNEGNDKQMIEAVKKALEKNMNEDEFNLIYSHTNQFSPEEFDVGFLAAISDLHKL